MDCYDYTTEPSKHKKGAHLDLSERARKIEVLASLHYSVRAIQ